jgi:hypothetical protein
MRGISPHEQFRERIEPLIRRATRATFSHKGRREEAVLTGYMGDRIDRRHG